MTPAELRKELDAMFAAAGFRRRGKAWVLHGEDNVVSSDLQKSAYDGQYWINVEVCPVGAAADAKATFRMEALSPQNELALTNALNLDQPHVSSEALYDVIAGKFLPIAISMSTAEGLRHLYEEVLRNGALITKAFRQKLEGPT